MKTNSTSADPRSPPTSPSRRRSQVIRRLRSEEHTSELQSRQYLVCRLLLENKNHRSGGRAACRHTGSTPATTGHHALNGNARRMVALAVTEHTYSTQQLAPAI